MTYKAIKTEIVEVETGRQIAVVLQSNCSKKQAAMMAAYAAERMNHDLRRKELEAAP